MPKYRVYVWGSDKPFEIESETALALVDLPDFWRPKPGLEIRGAAVSALVEDRPVEPSPSQFYPGHSYPSV